MLAAKIKPCSDTQLKMPQGEVIPIFRIGRCHFAFHFCVFHIENLHTVAKCCMCKSYIKHRNLALEHLQWNCLLQDHLYHLVQPVIGWQVCLFSIFLSFLPLQVGRLPFWGESMVTTHKGSTARGHEHQKRADSVISYAKMSTVSQ